jgi:GAF domain-containing protein
MGDVAAEEGAVERLRARLSELVVLLRTDVAVLFRSTPSGDFEVVTAAGTSPTPSAGELVPGRIDSVCGFAAAQHGAVIFEDVPATARFSGATMATKFGAVSSVVVALRHRGEVAGIMSVHSRTLRSFTGAEARDIEAAAEGLVSDWRPPHSR